MTREGHDTEREDRIAMEIVVDAYDPEEVKLGWYYYLEKTLQFPFPATYTIKRRSSPTPEIKTVSVVGMASEEECEQEILVEVDWDGDILATSLIDLEAPEADPQTQQAVADWHYWVNQGNDFS